MPYFHPGNLLDIFLNPDEAVAYAKANNLSFIETSALDATNVKRAFEKYGPRKCQE